MILHLKLLILLSKFFMLLGFNIKEKNDIPSSILKEFPDHQITFHYDDTTHHHLSLFFLQSLNINTVVLFNYKCKYRLVSFKRPAGYNYLHIVYMKNPFLFEKFSSVQFNLEYSDAVIFVVEEYVKREDVDDNFQTVEMWNQQGMDKCGTIFVYDIIKNNFYYVHYYVGEVSGVLQDIQLGGRDVPRLLDYMNEFKDFKGHVFQVAFYPYEPFIWCSEKINGDTGKYECETQGIDGNILLLLSRYLNFNFVMRKAELKSGGAWKGMIEDVHFRRRDWAVGGISTSLERLQLADFTTMLHMESYTAFYASTGQLIDDWNGILRSFQANVWITLFLLLMLVGLVLQLSRRKLDNNRRTRLHPVLDFIRIPFHAVVEQSIPTARARFFRFFTIRLLLGIWCLTSIILTTAYKSKLAASMIRPFRREPNTVLDLYDTGFSFQVNNEDWTVLQQSLVNSIDTRYQKIIDRCYDDLPFCDAIAKAIRNKFAILDEETAMPYIIFNVCIHLYTPADISSFRLVRQVIFPSVHAWPLQLSAPFRYRFSYTFQILISAGIIEHWYKKLIGRSIIKSNSFTIDSSTSSALTIDTFVGPAFILIIGLLVATSVFACEIVRKKYSREM